jgi:cell division protein FtsW (lipid II flippase)
MLQLILHLIGDYVTQSDWMAQRKTQSSIAALAHATVYSLPFLLIGSAWAWLVIWSTHFLIDRFRLARYVVWAKNFLAPSYTLTMEGTGALYEKRLTAKTWWHPWQDCQGTGYHKDTPPWLAVWLMIAADNTLHLAINYAALRWL